MRTLRFTEMINKYKDLVFTYSLYFLGERQDAEDVSQEVLLKVWQHLDDIKWGSAKAWILTTTRHLCIDFVRKRKRIGRQNGLANDQELDGMPAELVESDPFEMAHAGSLKAHIGAALLQLPELQRSVLIMREIQDMSYREISKALAIPLNSTRVYIMRGRQAMRSILTKTLKGELKDV